jgi:hypothetical protein
MMPQQNQGELSFGQSAPETGYDRWKHERAEAMKNLALKLGLPLGRRVEVWLRGNIRLTGKLQLAEETIFVPDSRDQTLRLVVDGVPFTSAEIESCVRAD